MKIKDTELCAFIFFMLQTCLFSYVINSTVRYAGVNCWIISIIGTIIGFPLFLLYLYIFSYKKELNINQLNINLFGKSGKIINLLLTLFIGFAAMILFWNLSNFVSTQYLYRTPQFFVEIFFIIAFLYIMHNGINALFRTTLILLYIIIIIYIINIIGLFGQIDTNNIKPFFYGNHNYIKAIFNYIVFTSGPTFLLLIIAKKNIESKNLNKKLILTYFISNISTFIILFLIISIFGINLVNLYQYPGYHILKRVTILGFAERLEKILALYWILTLFVGVIFSLYYVLKSLKDNFNVKKSSYLILFIILYCSQYIFKNNTIAKEWIEVTFPYIVAIFFILIPLIIFIKIKIKKDQLLDQTIN